MIPYYCPACDEDTSPMILMFGEVVCAECEYFFGFIEDYEED